MAVKALNVCAVKQKYLTLLQTCEAKDVMNKGWSYGIVEKDGKG